jgi:hypothetical protein
MVTLTISRATYSISFFQNFVEMRMNGAQRDVQSENTFGTFFIRPLVNNSEARFVV